MSDSTSNFIYYNYYKDTTQQSRDAVKNTVAKLVRKLNNNNNFLKGFTFHVVNDYKDLSKTSEFTKYVKTHHDEFCFTGGMTIPTASNNNKGEIIINTSPGFGLASIFTTNKSKKLLAAATMHEIGHQFDDYYGSCDEDLLNEIKKMPFETTEEQDKIIVKWQKQKDLSDTKDFKAAWKKDAQNLGKSSWSNFWFKHFHVDYYVWDVDITDGVSQQEVDDADFSRSEIFAQLFSYAMGEDDGEKDAIINKYPNCYKKVKEYIKKYLNINL